MSELDALLARSRDPSRLVERRRFTLSRDRAIEKLRRFSLRDPSQYVLELIQAAVLHGADYVLVSLEPGATFVAWSGAPPIPRDELEQLFSNLFADHATPGRRHLSQLAIGANAVLQQRVKRLRIESGDGTAEGAARLELDAAGQGIFGQPESSFPGTWISIRFRRGLWERIRPQTFREEEALIEERCRHCPVPILLDGRAPFGWKPRRRLEVAGLLHPEHVSVEGCEAVIGVLPEGQRGEGFSLVVGGVEITRTDLPELGGLPLEQRTRPERPGVGGVIACDALRKTADQSDIVRDDRYVRMLHAVRPALVRSVQRHLRRRVAFPPLPPLRGQREIHAGRAPDVAPVPDPVPQLPPRPPLPLEQVRGLARRGTPVLRMHPGQAATLQQLARPSLLPLPVLLLEDAQARGLMVELQDDRELPLLSTAADIELARRLVESRAPRLRATAPVVPKDQPAFSAAAAGGGAHWTLELFAPADAPSVCGDGSVVLILTDSEGREAVAQGGPPGLPPLVVRGPSPQPLSEPPSRRALEAECWRAAASAVELLRDPPRADGEDRECRAALAAGLLAWAAVPAAVEPGPAGPTVVLRLPPAWEPHREALLQTPLAWDTHGTALTAAQLLQQAARPGPATPVQDAAAATTLAPLERAWGAGLSWHAPREQRLAAAVHDGVAWRVADETAPGPRLEVWTARRPPDADALRADLSWVWWAGAGRADPEGALDVLLSALQQRLHHPPPGGSHRARQAAVHAGAELARALGELDARPLLLPPSPGAAWRPVPPPADRGWVPWRPAVGGLQPVPPAVMAEHGPWSRWTSTDRPVEATGLRGHWGPVSAPGQALIWDDAGPLVAPLPHNAIDAVLCTTAQGRDRLVPTLRRTSGALPGSPLAPARALQQTTAEARRARKLLQRLLHRTATGTGLLEGRPVPHPDHPLSAPASRGQLQAAWALVLSLGADEPEHQLQELHEAVIDVLSTGRTGARAEE
jgi:hypothetical protein